MIKKLVAGAIALGILFGAVTSTVLSYSSTLTYSYDNISIETIARLAYEGNFIIQSKNNQSSYLEANIVPPSGLTWEDVGVDVTSDIYIYDYIYDPNFHMSVSYFDEATLQDYTYETNPGLEEAEYVDQLPEGYNWYLELNFDANGKLTVATTSDYLALQLSGESLSRVYKNETWVYNEAANELDVIAGISQSDIDAVQLKNISLKFGIPDELVSEGITYNGIARIDLENLFAHAAILSCLVFLSGLLFPISIVKEWGWFKAISKIKFDILFVIIVGTTLFVATMLPQLIYAVVYNYETIDSFVEFAKLGLWVVVYGTILIVAWGIRFIFDVGFKGYFMDYTIAGAIVTAIRKLLSLDLTSKTNKKAGAILFVNFVISSLICFIFPLGSYVDMSLVILVLAIYNVVVGYYVLRFINRIVNNYNTLGEVIKRLSNEDFNVELSDDLGVFESMKENIEELRNGFATAVQEEVKSQKMKSELITNVSHDLKTPLTSIVSYSELLKNEEDNQKREEYLATIERNAQRLKKLIEDLFEVSKANSKNITLDLVQVDVVSLMKQALTENQSLLEEANLEVKLSHEDEKVIHLLDSFKTYRIFENLIVNICKYSQPNTRVYISIQETPEQILVSFKNISAVALDIDVSEITERFVRGDKSRNTEGSGLGLAIVQSFCELQNGKLQIDVDADLFKVVIQFKKA